MIYYTSCLAHQVRFAQCARFLRRGTDTQPLGPLGHMLADGVALATAQLRRRPVLPTDVRIGIRCPSGEAPAVRTWSGQPFRLTPWHLECTGELWKELCV